MLSFLYAAAETFLPCLLQFAAGLALGLILVRAPFAARAASLLGKAPLPARAASAFASALLGCAIPLGPAGAVPIAAAALVLGIGAPLAIPFLLSDLLFNMLVPFADPTFIWRTGYVRAAFALIAGCIGGLIAMAWPKAASSWFRSGLLPALEGLKGSDLEGVGSEGAGAGKARAGAESPAREGPALPLLLSLAVGAGFLAAGALADIAFRRYALGAIMAFAYTNPAVSFVPDFLASRNVVNPLFLQTMRIAALLTGFGSYAALALVLRPRGFLRYFAYLAAWTILLGLSAFLEV